MIADRAISSRSSPQSIFVFFWFFTALLLAPVGLPQIGLIVEEIGRGASAIRTVISVRPRSCARASSDGAKEQKRKFTCRDFDRGRGRLLGLTEPDNGFGCPPIQRTRARRSDSGWVINGAKMWISMGNSREVA